MQRAVRSLLALCATLLFATACGAPSSSSPGLDAAAASDAALTIDGASARDLVPAPDLASASDLSGGLDLAAAPDLWSGPDVGCGPPSPQLITAYQACANAQDQTTCVAKGGDWRNVFNIPNGPFACYCLTGQNGCPCQQNLDCVGGCHISPDPVTQCSPPKPGVCARSSIESVCLCIGPDPVCP